MKKIEMNLEPLSCPSCIKRIEKAMSKEKGVEEARVLFNSSKIKAKFDESVLSAEDIEKTIEKLGYSVTKTKTV